MLLTKKEIFWPSEMLSKIEQTLLAVDRTKYPILGV